MLNARSVRPVASVDFYGASALLTMQTANSYELSVCLSVTFRYFVQTNEDTIVQFSASRRKIILG